MTTEDSRTLCDDAETTPTPRLLRARPFTGEPLRRPYLRSRWEGVLALLLVLLPVLAALMAFASLGHASPGGRIASANPVPAPLPPGLLININVADSAQLSLVPGLTDTKIAAILEYRSRHSFQVPADVMKVKGIGPSTYARIKPWITVDGPPVREVAVANALAR